MTTADRSCAMPPELIDAQVHVWEHDHPGRPWNTAPPPQVAEPAPFFEGTSVVTDDEMLRMMDEVGVDAAILVTSSRHYGVDNSYALEAAARHPDRFRVVARVDPADPAVGEQIAAFGADPLVLGVRLLTMSDPDRARFRDGGFDPVFAAAAESDIPLCIYPTGTLPLVAETARRFPDLQLVVDHLGLVQRPVATPGSDPFAELPELLALAPYANVTVKLSGVATLSWQPFPFEDVWPHVHRVLEAFGPERVMWGSDATRAEGVVTYAEGVRWLTDAGELGEDELALVLGQTLRRVFRWT
jgi:L-fuconolactonase